MRRTSGRTICWALAACLAVSCAPSAALAATADSPSHAPVAAAGSEVISQGGMSAQLSAADLGIDPTTDNAELFAAYAERTLYGSPQRMQPLAKLGSTTLTGLSLKLYSALREAAAQVADGARSSSRILVTWDQLGLTQTKWTRTELGVDIASGGKLNEDAVWAAIESKTGFGSSAISAAIDCLMHDCPFELYWYDKTSGCGFQIEQYYYTPEYFQLASKGIEFSFAVTRDYAPGGASGGYVLDTHKTSAASRAAASAKAIVAANASKSDYEKLAAYKDAICAAVQYNFAAAGSAYSGGYGDPWQLIYVFDGDAATNVVCEGYSKAFQYLCDLSAFSGDVGCYTVTGVMRGGTGAGAHMWNVVRISGASYLVDVTNCDGDAALGSFTSGYPDRLFLAGATDGGSVEGGFAVELPEHVLPDGTRLRSSTISYEYDSATTGLFGTGSGSILNLASESYDPSTTAAGPAGGEGGSGEVDQGQLAPGTSFKAGGITYRVTAAGKVTVAKIASSARTATVPATVSYRGATLKVVGISPKALKSCKATTLVVKTKLLTKKSVASALKGSKVAVVKVKVSSSKTTNKLYVAKYKKLFTSANCGRVVKVTL